MQLRLAWLKVTEWQCSIMFVDPCNRRNNKVDKEILKHSDHALRGENNSIGNCLLEAISDKESNT